MTQLSTALSRNAEIRSMVQSVDLDTHQVRYSLVLRLPTGHDVVVHVDQPTWEGLSKFYRYPSEAGCAQEVSPVAAPEEPPLSDDEREALEQPVEWGQLPDDVLSPQLKRAMRFYQLPAVLPVGVVYDKAMELAERLTPEDWKQLEKAGDQQPYSEEAFEAALQEPAEPAPQATTPVGEVAWSNGDPILPSRRGGSRKVSVDERGNPLLNMKDVDPGEIAGGGDDVDEDGVSSW